MKEIQNTIDRVNLRSPLYSQDGSKFKNSHLISPNAKRLDTKGDYTEWTVRTPGVGNRGKRRIVYDKKSGRAYYSHDHYEDYIEIDL